MRNGARKAFLFFVLGYSCCLVVTTVVKVLNEVDVNFPLHREKALVKSVFFPVGECPECKKIASQYWKIDKLNDDNNVHLAAARRMGVGPFASNAAFEAAKTQLVSQGRLQEIKDCESYQLKNLTHSYPYVVPAAIRMLDEIGQRFEGKLERLQIPPFRMQISSVLRTMESQSGLGKHNFNAADTSAHMFGTTVDISYKEFIQQSGEKAKEGFCRHDMMRHVLAEVLTEMRSEGKCAVVIERKQACFHITCTK